MPLRPCSCVRAGPAAHLQELGIPLARDLPGVGANLQDHLQLAIPHRIDGADTLNRHMNSRWRMLAMLMRYVALRQGPLTMAPCQVGLFTHSRAGLERPDLGYNVLAFSRASGGKVFDPHPGVTMISYDLRPSSRGQVRLSSADAHAAPGGAQLPPDRAGSAGGGGQHPDHTAHHAPRTP